MTQRQDGEMFELAKIGGDVVKVGLKGGGGRKWNISGKLLSATAARSKDGSNKKDCFKEPRT